MMKLIKGLLFLSCFIPFCATAQDLKYTAFLSDSLTRNANVVVREYSASFVQTDKNTGVYKMRKVITILNKRGEDSYASFAYSGDKYRKLSSFSAVIRNALGKEIKKVKKGDLMVSSIVNGAETLASDDVVWAYEFKSPSYPYTIEYNVEIKYGNGILMYPPFDPMNGYTVSVESAEYSIQTPIDITLRSKSNFALNIDEVNANGKNVYSMSVKNLKAIEYEPYSPDSRKVRPLVIFAPSEFCYDSHCGNMSNWRNYGLWANELLKDRDAVPPALAAELNNITQNASSEKEKVKIVYEYLQNNTRYLNIAFGIGGFQPFKAMEVAKTGFGDCKGLSNYMKSMLKAIGITSYYCEIYTGNRFKYLDKDFTSLDQTNHAIVMVPLKNDTVWLECTSPIAPFGYIHDGIVGHDALVISEEGGKICRLPSYPDAENRTVTKMVYTLSESGEVKGDIYLSEFMSNSESTNSLFKKNNREGMVRYTDGNVRFPHVYYGDFKTNINASERPSTTLSVDFTSTEFANKTGNRLFVPICPLKKGNFDLFKSSKRNLDIDIALGFSEQDTIIVTLPMSYSPESLPKDIELKTAFGNYAARTEYKDGKVFYIQDIDLFSGTYDKSQYNDMKAFLDEIVSGTKRRLVLKKDS